MSEVTPPPTVAHDDVHVHRRESDNGDAAWRHKRWYDSTKMQLAVALAVVSFGGSCYGSGMLTAGWRNTLDTAPSVHAQQWEAINANTARDAEIIDKLDEVVQAVNKMTCVMEGRTNCPQQSGIDPLNRGS